MGAELSLIVCRSGSNQTSAHVASLSVSRPNPASTMFYDFIRTPKTLKMSPAMGM
jgi:hypothetical protein